MVNGDAIVTSSRNVAVRIHQSATLTPPRQLRAVNWANQWLMRLEHELFGGSGEPNETRLAEMIDIDSWVDFVVLQEVGKNPSGYESAIFSEDEERRLRAGPLLDFDNAFGNLIQEEHHETHVRGLLVQHEIDETHDHGVWFRRLFARAPWFRERFVCRWRALRVPGQPLHLEEIRSFVLRVQATLETHQVLTKRWVDSPSSPVFHERWPMDAITQELFEANVDRLLGWIEKRLTEVDASLPLYKCPPR